MSKFYKIVTMLEESKTLTVGNTYCLEGVWYKLVEKGMDDDFHEYKFELILHNDEFMKKIESNGHKNKQYKGLFDVLWGTKYEIKGFKSELITEEGKLDISMPDGFNEEGLREFCEGELLWEMEYRGADDGFTRIKSGTGTNLNEIFFSHYNDALEEK